MVISINSWHYKFLTKSRLAKLMWLKNKPISWTWRCTSCEYIFELFCKLVFTLLLGIVWAGAIFYIPLCFIFDIHVINIIPVENFAIMLFWFVLLSCSITFTTFWIGYLIVLLFKVFKDKLKLCDNISLKD